MVADKLTANLSEASPEIYENQVQKALIRLFLDVLLEICWVRLDSIPGPTNSYRIY